MSGRLWQWLHLGFCANPLVILADPVQISEHELNLLEDRGFLLTKRTIDEKVTAILLSSQKRLISHIKEKEILIPQEVSLTPRKIARGENYQGLPYWVCDFPASLNKQDVWSFRIVVWWGHTISLSLVLKGKFKALSSFPSLLQNGEDVFYSLHQNPWKLELDTKDSIRLNKKNTREITEHHQKADFIKLSTVLGLNHINKLPQQSVISFDELLARVNYLA